MNIAKVIQQRLRRSAGGARVDGDVNAVVSANVGERGRVTRVSSTQHVSTSSSARRSGSDGPKAA